MFKIIWDNFIGSFFVSIFAAVVVLIVSGAHMGYSSFWFNTILFTVVFTVWDLIKKRNVKEES
jgi:uncharacterized membrane protein